MLSMKPLILLFLLTLPVSAQDNAVTVKQENGVWWFRSPTGANFLSIGANHVEPLYWQSPRNAEFVRETYGGEIFAKDGSFDEESAAVKKWSANVAVNFKDWGFNTLGFHNPLSRSLQEAIRRLLCVPVGDSGVVGLEHEAVGTRRELCKTAHGCV